MSGVTLELELGVLPNKTRAGMLIFSMTEKLPGAHNTIRSMEVAPGYRCLRKKE